MSDGHLKSDPREKSTRYYLVMSGSRPFRRKLSTASTQARRCSGRFAITPAAPSKMSPVRVGWRLPDFGKLRPGWRRRWPSGRRCLNYSAMMKMCWSTC